MSMNLDVLLTEGEAVAAFSTTDSPVFNVGAIPYHMIVSSEIPIEHQDLGGCLEDTLHRLLDACATSSDIEDILGAVPSDRIEDIGNGITEIDLGYAIPGQLMTIEVPDPPLPPLSTIVEEANRTAAGNQLSGQTVMPEMMEL